MANPKGEQLIYYKSGGKEKSMPASTYDQAITHPFNPLYGRESSAKLNSLRKMPYMTPDSNKVQSFKKGGMVKKTGLAKVHKGERVLTKKQQAKLNNFKKCNLN